MSKGVDDFVCNSEVWLVCGKREFSGRVLSGYLDLFENLVEVVPVYLWLALFVY